MTWDYKTLYIAINQLKTNSQYSAFELTSRFKKLLKEFGFACTFTTRTPDGADQEIYESSYSDGELRAMAETKINEFKNNQEKRHNAIQERYSQSDIVDSDEIFYK